MSKHIVMEKNINLIGNQVTQITGLPFEQWRFDKDNPDCVVLEFSETRFNGAFTVALMILRKTFESHLLTDEGYVRFMAQQLAIQLLKLLVDALATESRKSQSHDHAH